ncbi:MAG: hypothetical protein AB7N91_21660 [Candidatus Tectimicrobiota bacterium]
MDFHRLLLVLLQRLSPVYVATALWWLTDYFAIMLGGVALSVILMLAWPFIQPFLAVLYEEVLQQRGERQAQRRATWLTTLLPFLHAYIRVVAKYPPALLTASGPTLAAQLDILAKALQQINRQRQTVDPFAVQEQDAYTVVHSLTCNAQDLRDWSLQQCQTWAAQLWAALAQREMPTCQQAVQHFLAGHARRTWEACLTRVEQALDAEVEHTLRQWACLHKAQAQPDIRQRLATLLRLDAINRQAHLQPYLTARPVACTPEEVREVMAYIRYDAVATRLLALLEAPLTLTAPAVRTPLVQE